MIKIKDILAKIAPNGHPTGSVKLRATIADLERQMAEADRLVATADDRAKAMLLADEDKKLDTIEAEVRAAQRDIDKAEAALPGLRDRLNIAIAHEKQEAVGKYFTEAQSIAKEIIVAVDKLLDLNNRAYKNFSAASRELGEGVARMAVPDVAYNGMVNPVGVEAWKRFVGAETAARSRQASVAVPIAPVASKPATAAPKRVTDARGDVLIVIGAEGYKNSEFERWAPGAAVSPCDRDRDLRPAPRRSPRRPRRSFLTTWSRTGHALHFSNRKLTRSWRPVSQLTPERNERWARSSEKLLRAKAPRASIERLALMRIRSGTTHSLRG